MQVPLECTLEELYRGCEKVVEASADVPEALLVKVCALLKAVFPSFGHENNENAHFENGVGPELSKFGVVSFFDAG